MRVFITGGTGLIGRRLVRRLIERGDRPVILTRNADRARLSPALKGADVVQGDPTAHGGWEAAIEGSDAVVNLAGQNIFERRWNDDVRRLIRDSRVSGTEHVVAAIAAARDRPKVLVQGSAIGYYGIKGDEELTESSPPGDDFMANICRDWEAAAAPAEGLGLRLALIRTGIVLARGEGALGAMTPPFLVGPGAPIGSGSLDPNRPRPGPKATRWEKIVAAVRDLVRPARGQQWMSWVHVDDIVGILLTALDVPEARGPINGVAPNPVRNAEFSRTLSKVLWRPHAPQRFFLPFGPPDAAIKLALGDVAELITTGQKVLPERARALGFQFRYPDLESALRAAFAAPEPAGQESKKSAGALTD